MMDSELSNRARQEKVIPLDPHERYVRKKERLRQRHGRRHSIPHVPREIWQQGYDRQQLIRLALRLNEFTVAELRVLLYVINEQPAKRPLTQARLARELCMDRGNVSRLVKRLSDCQVLINLSKMDVDLAARHGIEYWRTHLLPSLRKARSGYDRLKT